MLNEFISWGESVSKSKLPDAVTIYLTIGEPSPNRSARLDIDTPTAVARITCWDSGEYNAEALSVESEEVIYSFSGRIEPGRLLTEQFGGLFQALNLTLLTS